MLVIFLCQDDYYWGPSFQWLFFILIPDVEANY